MDNKNPAAKIITLLTDFGTVDPYAGIMKGVMVSICPGLSLIDLTHEVPPQEVRTAAWHIAGAYGYFPQGTVHLAVVDPGVGSARKPIVVCAGGYYFVGPDNGIFSAIYSAVSSFEAYELSVEEYFLSRISRTFHGRDIFAPVAAHLACGVDPNKLGKQLSHVERLTLNRPELEGTVLSAEVMVIDRFGNVITNITRGDFASFAGEKQFIIEAEGRQPFGLRSTYTEAKPGELIALFGSTDNLEISLNQGNAAEKLQARPGTKIRILRTD